MTDEPSRDELEATIRELRRDVARLREELQRLRAERDERPPHYL